jgi:hypothetical protein
MTASLFNGEMAILEKKIGDRVFKRGCVMRSILSLDIRRRCVFLLH